MVSAVTIGGIDYRLHYGILVEERFSSLVVGEDGVKKDPTGSQLLTCIIHAAHESWCEISDEPLRLKRSDVAKYIEEIKANKNADLLAQLKDIEADFAASRFIEDLVKRGKESTDKKKEEPIGTTLNESPLES